MNNNQIHFRAEFTIEKWKIEEYKKLVQDMIRMVENNEQNIINSQFYLNRWETTQFSSFQKVMQKIQKEKEIESNSVPKN